MKRCLERFIYYSISGQIECNKYEFEHRGFPCVYYGIFRYSNDH